MTDTLYTERLAPWWSTGIAAALAIAVIPIAFSSVPTAGAMLVAAAISFWFGRARYVVSAAKLEVWVGFGWPHLVIAAADLDNVTERASTALRAGGWGYRGSWTLFKRAAISLGGRGWVDLETRTRHQLRLSTNHPKELQSAISTLLHSSS